MGVDYGHCDYEQASLSKNQKMWCCDILMRRYRDPQKDSRLSSQSTEMISNFLCHGARNFQIPAPQCCEFSAFLC